MKTHFVSKTLLMPSLLVVQKLWCGVNTEKKMKIQKVLLCLLVLQLRQDSSDCCGT